MPRLKIAENEERFKNNVQAQISWEGCYFIYQGFSHNSLWNKMILNFFIDGNRAISFLEFEKVEEWLK